MSTQFDVKNFLTTLTCPVTFTPLTTAVNLHPCCHKVNQVVAERLYGPMIGDSCQLQGKPCIVCKTPVKAWTPDHTIKSLASQIFGHEEELETLPTHPLVLETQEEKEAEVNIPYPGIRAVFVWTSGHWNQTHDSGSDLCRSVCFRSITQGSLLKQFDLLGYSNGEVSISISIMENNFFKEYLRAHRMVCSTNFYYITKTPEDLKKLFCIIARNNEIPAEQFNQIREIVERGTCSPTSRRDTMRHYEWF